MAERELKLRGAIAKVRAQGADMREETPLAIFDHLQYLLWHQGAQERATSVALASVVVVTTADGLGLISS